MCTENASVVAKPKVKDLFAVVRAQGLLPGGLSFEQARAARDIERCRTAALGGHIQRCGACGNEEPRYNSCRNRHCPECQSLRQARWLMAREERMLKVGCFHVVFTVPKQLRGVTYLNQRELYGLLFKAASQTLLELSASQRWLGGQPGVTAVLHTWRRDLGYHPHLHCLVTAGGLSPDGERWVDSDPNFLAPVRVMGRLFRGKFMEGLKSLHHRGALKLPEGLTHPTAYQHWLDTLYGKRWQVYAKRPFSGPGQVMSYLGRYTHRVAISSSRLRTFDGEMITFATRGDERAKLPVETFVGRFLRHVLPKGFTKIRHYGLWAPGNVNGRLEVAREKVEEGLGRSEQADGEAEVEERAEGDGGAVQDWKALLKAVTDVDVRRCRKCGAEAVLEWPLPPRNGEDGARGPPNGRGSLG